MAEQNYLLSLTGHLAEGLSRLPDAVRERHVSYLAAAQNADGGFSGREGGSDLYYTSFALRSLAVLDALTFPVCEKAAPFLRQSLSGQASVVDFVSLLFSCFLVQAAGGPDVLADSPPDWRERVAGALEALRTPDGGYAKAAGGASGSTYHTFLVGLCYQLLDRPMPGATDVARFVRSRQREDGGYVEIAPMRRGGTNPTAAAVGLLQLLDGADGLSGPTEAEKEQAAGFLAALQSPEGGFQANSRAPLADLLSTFTATWTLRQLQALDRIDRADALQYAQALEQAGGGFRGGLWDERADVEYSFYGLGCLALLG